ncbi:MAG: Uma2 family endonuclease [Caldilineaceae bacterium]
MASVAKVEQPVNGVYEQEPLTSLAEPVDRYPYGYRVAQETQPDETVGYSYIPLTQADFLDPQEGDRLTQSDPHIKFVFSLVSRFLKHYLGVTDVGVFSDLKMLWRIPGLKEPAPDLAIVPNLVDQHKYRGSFDVVAEGTRPCLVVEVMSPQYPGDDTIKVDIYRQAQIPEYIIINPHFEDEENHFELIGYRLVGKRYQRMKPDAQGRLLSETTGVWFGLDESGRDLILTNARTVERLLTDEEEYEARLAAEAEVARLKALLEKRNGH